jgi:hypothetical protein
MRPFLALFCALTAAQSVTIAQQTPPKRNEYSPSTAPPELTNALDARIKSEWEAIKNKDQKALGEILTDDFVGVEVDREGERYKWKMLGELQNSVVTSYTLSFLKVTALCPDAALVRYEVFMQFPPKSLVRFEKVLVAEVWVKRDGVWKSMHYQETKVK